MAKVPARRGTGPSTDSVLQTLKWMRHVGISPVPLHPSSKAAISRDYVATSYQPPDDLLWQQENYGVGAVTGPRHSGPVDVDLDCDEAIFFAPRFLPPTPAVFGRKSKPRSHYLYRVDASGFDKVAYGDPARRNETIVEARGDGGHQTVMPGNVHEGTGEAIEWSDVPFPELPVVDAEALSKAVAKIAIATLVARHIWADGYHNEPTKHLSGMLFYLEWPLEDAEELIQAVMDWSGDEDKSRIPTVRTTYRRGEAGKKISGAGVLRKQINNDPVVDRLLEWAGSDTVNFIQEYNDRYACLSMNGKFRIVDTDYIYDPSDAPTFHSKEDWLNIVGNDRIEIEIDGKLRKVTKGQVWLRHPRRRFYRAVNFMPGVTDDDNILNMWRGWAVEPKEPPPDTTGCDAFIELLHRVICGGDDQLYIWMMHWFANIIREPMQKAMTAPVIIGVEGAGKSLMTGYFGQILGGGYTVVTNDRHVHGAFNKHLATTLLLHSEEALYAGDQKHAAIIRSLITDEFRMFEAKGVDASPMRNYLRLILLSNKDNAAPAQTGDRRYTVIHMGQRKLSDDLKLRVLKEKDGDGPAHLLHLLQTMDYDPNIPRLNIKNDDLLRVKTHNLTGVEAWWLEVLMSGQLLPDRLAWAQKPEKVNWPPVVGGPALYAAMTTALRDQGVRYIPHNVAFFNALTKMLGGAKLQRAQRSFSNLLVGEIGVPQLWSRLNDRQLAILDLPPLDACREAFDQYVGQAMDWPEPPTEDGPGKGRRLDDDTPAF